VLHETISLYYCIVLLHCNQVFMFSRCRWTSDRSRGWTDS